MYAIGLERVPELFLCIKKEMAFFDLREAVLSPKGFFLPMQEGLYSSEQADGTYKITAEPLSDKPFVLFGVRACDAAAIGLLDAVFADGEADPFYQARREAAYIITSVCASFEETCFCGAFGIEPDNPLGDVLTWENDGNLYWLPYTKKGEELTERLDNDLLKKIEEPYPPIRQVSIEDEIAPGSGYMKSLPYIVPENTDAMLAYFTSPAWDEIYKTCIACGTCTFLCPTCQCYDITQQENGEKVHCTRHWDVCLNAGFTQMAHGNPRPTQKERFRQRFMHKLVYYPQKYGVYGCVGCGRCVQHCPVNMNIITVARVLEKHVESVTLFATESEAVFHV